MLAEFRGLTHAVIHAVFTPGCAAGDQGSVGSAQHRIEDIVEDKLVVLEEGRFIRDDLVRRVTPQKLRTVGQGDDFAAIAETDSCPLSLADERLMLLLGKAGEEVLDAVAHYHALAEGGSHYQGQCLRVGACVPDSAEGDAGGFARLPAPSYDDAFCLVPEEASLIRIDLETEKFIGENKGVFRHYKAHRGRFRGLLTFPAAPTQHPPQP